MTNRNASESSRLKRSEALKKIIDRMNLFDNTFFSVALSDKKACEHILRILMKDPKLKVLEVQTQKQVSQLLGKDIRLDIVAESAGAIYSIEVQRKDSEDHPRRTRFYSSAIISDMIFKGETYNALPEHISIYISETDLLKQGRTVYDFRMCDVQNNVYWKDGYRVLCVNAAVNDGSAIAQLMQYFKTSNPYDSSQGHLSNRVAQLKQTKGGHAEMNEYAKKIFEEYKEYFFGDELDEAREKGHTEGLAAGLAEGRAAGRAEGRAEGQQLGQAKIVAGFMKKQGCSLEEAFNTLNIESEDQPAIAKLVNEMLYQPA